MNWKRRPWWIAVLCLLGLAWAGERSWTLLQHARMCAQEYEPPPPGMVLVPAGAFLMGSNDPSADPDESPLRSVFVPAFYIDQFEVTNRRYRDFKKDHRYPAGEDDLPVTFVFKREAEEFCRWAGRRVPTNAEWEKAARGSDGRIYPWGNEFIPDRANINRRGPVLVSTSASSSNNPNCNIPTGPSRGKLPGGSFPKGASPYGCQDMVGNVWEWVSDVCVDKNWYGGKLNSDARGILRGGASSYSAKQARASYQGLEALDATCHDVGFRCVLAAIPKKK